MKPNEPETVNISTAVAMEEELARLMSAEQASKNRILFLAQSNANLKARLAELEVDQKPAQSSDKAKAKAN